MSTYHIYSLASHHALSPEVESGGVTGSCGLPLIDPGCCAFQGGHLTSRQLQPTIPVEMVVLQPDEATVIDQARTHKELLLKEAIHIRLQHSHIEGD